VLEGYYLGRTGNELFSGREPPTESEFWMSHIIGWQPFITIYGGMPTDAAMAEAREAARAAWAEIAREKLDAFVASRAKPARPERRSPPPRAPAIDDSGLLHEMCSILTADPSLSVWKAADMMSARATGGPSLRSRRDRLIRKYKNTKWDIIA